MRGKMLVARAAMAVFAAFAAAEFALRVGPFRIASGLHSPRSPGECARWTGNQGFPAEFDVIHCLNSDGFHDVQHDESAPRGRRVVVLGDSYVDASQVRLERVFFRRLEAEWNSIHPRRPIELIAMGRSNTGQAEQLPILSAGLRYNPELVLAFFHGNDPSDNFIYLHEGHRAGFAEWELLRWSRTFTLLHLWTRPKQSFPEDWPATEGLLLDMRRLCLLRHARFALVYVPRPRTDRAIGDNFASQGMRIRRFCRSQGIPMVDLLPALTARQRSDGRSPYFRYEIHWNESGHSAVAKALAAALPRLLADSR